MTRECWAAEAATRPSFADVAGLLQEMLQEIEDKAGRDIRDVAIDVSAGGADDSEAMA